jgi:hypothetical protein
MQSNLCLKIMTQREMMKHKQSKRDNVIAKKFGRYKLIKLTTKLYNSLCESCKRKVLINPKIDIKEYCNDCKKKAEDIFGIYEK